MVFIPFGIGKPHFLMIEHMLSKADLAKLASASLTNPIAVISLNPSMVISDGSSFLNLSLPPISTVLTFVMPEAFRNSSKKLHSSLPSTASNLSEVILKRLSISVPQTPFRYQLSELQHWKDMPYVDHL